MIFNGHSVSLGLGSAILFILIYCTSCKTEIGPFPVEPKLDYQGIQKITTEEGKDSIIQIKMNFTDGDGDIGLGDYDTMPPFNFGSEYFYNAYISVKKQENGKLDYLIDPVNQDTINFNNRIPIITPSGDNKNIDGEITLNIRANFPVTQVPDSIQFTIFIYDRALHKSNEIQTPVFFINL